MAHHAIDHGKTLGVGILGAGPVTQAIHLPALATMPERFRVVSVMDVNEEVGRNVSDRCGAAHSASPEETIHNPDVDVVAICSPNAFHAGQVVAACEAGKRAILCEKPLAVSHSELQRIRAAAERMGTTIIVGTMHAYDPAYTAARAVWLKSGVRASFVESAIFLPGNDRFIDQATEQASAAPAQPQGGEGAEFEASMFEAAILGLAIHNVPLLRDFYPKVGAISKASYVRPVGCSVLMQNDGATASIQAFMPGNWAPKWRFIALGEGARLQVDFPPSYVLSGSAAASFTDAEGTRTFSYGESGYEVQWRHLHDVVTRGEPQSVPFDTALADIAFALDIAASGSNSIRSAA